MEKSTARAWHTLQGAGRRGRLQESVSKKPLMPRVLADSSEVCCLRRTFSDENCAEQWYTGSGIQNAEDDAMTRSNFSVTLAAAAIAGSLGLASDALAGWGRIIDRYYAPAPAVVTAAPVAVPTTTFYAPATHYAPATSYTPTVTYFAPPATSFPAPQAATHYAPAATSAYYAPPATTTYYAPAAVAPRRTYFAPGGSVITTTPRTRIGRPTVTTPTFPTAPVYAAPGVFVSP